MEALQPYSYQYNIKIVGFPQANESESSEDTAKLCLQLFSCLGVDGITLHDIDIAHRERPGTSFLRTLAYQKHHS